MKIKYHYDPDRPEEFRFDFLHRGPVTTNNLSDSVSQLALETREEMAQLGLTRAALCLSGIDSEVALHYLLHHGVEVECWTYNIDGIFDHVVESAALVCKKYQVDHRVVDFPLKELLAKKEFQRIYMKYRMPIIPQGLLSLLWRQIPKDRYILAGHGDPTRRFSRYEVVNPERFDTKNKFYLPISAQLAVLPQTYIIASGRTGRHSWYADSWDYYYHTLRHPLLETNKLDNYNTSAVKSAEFQHIQPIFQTKTCILDGNGIRGAPRGIELYNAIEADIAPLVKLFPIVNAKTLLEFSHKELDLPEEP